MSYYSKLGIGAKIIINVGAIVGICMLTMLTIITQESTKIQSLEAEKLVSSTARAIGNTISGYINEVMLSLALSQQNIENLFTSNDSNEAIMEYNLINMVKTTKWGSYGYVYLKDSNYMGGGGVTLSIQKIG
ncbi:hypothetical protein [Helicobacter trogontum]|nr:hypothetical protein [Helicobacter trogontum]